MMNNILAVLSAGGSIIVAFISARSTLAVKRETRKAHVGSEMENDPAVY